VSFRGNNWIQEWRPPFCCTAWKALEQILCQLFVSNHCYAWQLVLLWAFKWERKRMVQMEYREPEIVFLSESHSSCRWSPFVVKCVENRMVLSMKFWSEIPSTNAFVFFSLLMTKITKSSDRSILWKTKQWKQNCCTFATRKLECYLGTSEVFWASTPGRIRPIAPVSSVPCRGNTTRPRRHRARSLGR
jgi:hypothetical protein